MNEFEKPIHKYGKKQAGSFSYIKLKWSWIDVFGIEGKIKHLS